MARGLAIMVQLSDSADRGSVQGKMISEKLIW